MYGLFLGCDEKKKVEVIPFESVSKPLIVLSCRSWVCFKKRIWNFNTVTCPIYGLLLPKH